MNNNQTPYGYFPGNNFPPTNPGGNPNGSNCNCSREINNINSRIRNLERRITRLENIIMRDESSNNGFFNPNFISKSNQKYNDNNYMI